MFCYGKPFQYTLAILPYAEEILNHTHHERFPKPAWPGKECNFIVCIVNKLINQFSLINIVIS